MKILIVDDHRLFAHGMRLSLKQLSIEAEIVEAYTAQRALALVDDTQVFDLILTDIQMPGFGGHELVQSLISRKMSSVIGVVSASESIQDVLKAYNLGAKGYIYKSEPSFELIPKIKDLLDGKQVFPEALWRVLAEQQSNPDNENSRDSTGIGKRQLEVLKLLAQGKSNKQIAAILCISETTVKFHIRGLFNYFGVNNRTWCAREAAKQGIVDSTEL